MEIKVLKGKKINLPSQITGGFIYVIEDTGDVFIDINNMERIQINANLSNYIKSTTNSSDYYSYEDLKSLSDIVTNIGAIPDNEIIALFN